MILSPHKSQQNSKINRKSYLINVWVIYLRQEPNLTTFPTINVWNQNRQHDIQRRQDLMKTLNLEVSTQNASDWQYVKPPSTHIMTHDLPDSEKWCNSRHFLHTKAIVLRKRNYDKVSKHKKITPIRHWEPIVVMSDLGCSHWILLWQKQFKLKHSTWMYKPIHSINSHNRRRSIYKLS